LAWRWERSGSERSPGGRRRICTAPGDVQLDPGVLAFALLVSIATGLIFGALPAWQLSGANPIEALQSGAGRSSTASRGNLGTRRVLIGVEVALSATLLILGGLLTSSFVRLMRVEKGFPDRTRAGRLTYLFPTNGIGKCRPEHGCSSVRWLRCASCRVSNRRDWCRYFPGGANRGSIRLRPRTIRGQLSSGRW
jgi:hypothetical protein